SHRYFDKIINYLGENGIETIMCTPTATPPKWILNQSPDEAYFGYNMVKSEHGSREHVCYNGPLYRKRSEIIVEKVAKHYGNNPYVIAWQTHNEYNCPPVRECLCPHCEKKWHEWLKTKYKDIDELNEKWGNAVWSRSYQSFEDVNQPKYTPNGQNITLSNKYIEFGHDNVAEFNNMQVEIIKKYSDRPITHNTNVCFHINEETVFENLDFVSYDTYSTEEEKIEALFGFDMERGLKPNTPFFLMETSNSYTGHVHMTKPFHKRGYVKAEAASCLFAGGLGFCYWLFKQQRSGTELDHGHLITSWGKLSSACVNVKDVTKLMNEVNDYILSTKPRQAETAILFSDEARAYFECEMIEGYDYIKQIHAFYEAVSANGVYRDVVYESSDFDGYKVLFVPYLPYVSDTVYEKLVKAVNDGCTVVVGPFTGTRTKDHTIHTDLALSKLEKFMGVNVLDILSFNNQDATFKVFDKEYPLKSTSIVVEPDGNQIGQIKGGYCDGNSVMWQKNIGKGKIVLLGSVFEKEALKEITSKFIDEKVDFDNRSTDGVPLYKRVDANGNNSYCFVNMCGEEKTVKAKGENHFTKEAVDGDIILKPYEYVVIDK
ncbi:MAG: hypothetical protein E7369_02940, partial [Clostridiales bacterium]|nr:hypothetical protein [Clostridiales bacterium]